MDEDLKKLAQSVKTFAPQMLEPPYSGLPTFFGAPFKGEINDLDISLLGVPFDVGVTNRSGTRHGPREIRNQSRLVGIYNHRSRMTSFDPSGITALAGATMMFEILCLAAESLARK